MALQTISDGNIEYDYLTASTTVRGSSSTAPIPTRRGVAYCYYGHWQLLRVNTVTRERHYAVYIYNACQNDELVVPSNANQCVNDDNAHPTTLPSTCVTIEPGHVVAGLPPAQCDAIAEASVALNAALDPPTYDPTKSTKLTATTSFASDFLQRLDEGTCTDVLTWRVVGWTLTWPDGNQQRLPGTGHNGVTATHTLAPTPGATTPATADITAVAHLFIQGSAVDFDASGNLVRVTRTAFVDISNKATATGTGGAPTYTAPQLEAGGAAVSQYGDGTLPTVNPFTLAVSPHVDAIDGRLLLIYPRAIVVVPGTESVGGVLVGTGVTTTTSWAYVGTWTDAPAGEGTPPGTSGTTAGHIVVQYNHPERLDNNGHPVDERVPVTIRAVTTYPDGHTIAQTVSGSIAVTIYFIGLNNE